MFKKVFIVVLDIIVYNKDDEVERKTSFNLEFVNQLDDKHIRVIIRSLVYKNAKTEEVWDESVN